MSQQYAWKQMAIDIRRRKLDPQACGEALARIEAREALTPAAVVAAASRSRSPLHDGFEWDDPTAADLYRLNQARYLIENLIIQVEMGEAPPRLVRAFVHVVTNDEQEEDDETTPTRSGKYISMRVAMADPVTRDQVVRRALNELHAWQRRYSDLQEFANVIRAIEEIAETVTAEPVA